MTSAASAVGAVSQQHRFLNLTVSRAAHLLHTTNNNTANTSSSSSSVITPTQLAIYCHKLAQYGEESLSLNAFDYILPLEDILQQAHESEKRLQHQHHYHDEPVAGTNRRKRRSLLEGVPITIKANIATEGYNLTAGSDILQNHCMGYDSYVVRRLLRESGAILIGITSMDEFGMGSLGTNIRSSRTCTSHLLNEERTIHDVDNCNFATKNPLSFLRDQSSIQQYLQDSTTTTTASNSSITNVIQNEEDMNQLWIERIQNMDTNSLLYQHDTTDTSNSPHTSITTTSIDLQQLLLHHQNNNNNNNKNNNNKIEFLSSGGSSSGSATSISHGSSLISIGTDTGGSVRLPASWCGLVGMKPTYGMISRFGVVSYASSLDTVGVIGNSVDCVGIVMDELVHRRDDDDDNDSEEKKEDEEQEQEHVDDMLMSQVRDATAVFYPSSKSLLPEVTMKQPIEANDNNDDTHQNTTSTTTIQSSLQPLRGLKIGIPAAFLIEECPKEIQSAWTHTIHKFESLGASIQHISPKVISPTLIKHSLPAYYILACAEASSNLARYDGLRYGMDYNNNNGGGGGGDDDNNDSNYIPESSFFSTMTPRERQYSTLRAKGFGLEVIRRILCGTAVLSSDRFHTHYEAANNVRNSLSEQFNAVFQCEFDDNNDRTFTSMDDGNTLDESYSKGDGICQEQKVDLMLIPTTLMAPPPLENFTNDAGNMEKKKNDSTGTSNSTAAFVNDIMTVPISLAGLPSISVPVFVKDLDINQYDDNDDNGYSYDHDVIGMQIFGPKFSERVVLQAAHALQSSS